MFSGTKYSKNGGVVGGVVAGGVLAPTQSASGVSTQSAGQSVPAGSTGPQSYHQVMHQQYQNQQQQYQSQQQQQQQYQHQHQIKSIINSSSKHAGGDSHNGSHLISCSSGSSSSSSSTGSVNVKFSGFFKDKIDEREKYLTAKYPNHQMALIKKRLKVEFWIDEQLKNLFDITDENTKEDYDICPDDLVDTLLDMDTDNERRFHILKQLSNVKKSKENIKTSFVDELLVKLRIL